MARGKTVTEATYIAVKQLHTAGLSNTKIAAVLNYSDTTIGRMVNSDNFEHYREIQAEQSKKFPNQRNKDQELPLGEQPQPPAVDPVDMHLALIRRSLEMQDSMNASMLDHIGTMERIAERQAVALEQLVEAWNNTGKKGFLGR
jgi:DNA-binding MurR/RpiR family transcriptional regulator